MAINVNTADVLALAGITGADYLLGIDGSANEVVRVPAAGLAQRGATFFVDSVAGSDSNDGTSWAAAKATLDAAVALCTANRGDVILIAPGHNEGIGATPIDLDVAGVTVLGLGRGSARPRFDLDHASASIDIGANGVVLKNVVLLPSVTVVAIGIDVEAGVTDALIEDVEILPGEDGAGVDECVLGVDIKAGCSRTKVRRLKVRQHASADGANAGISLTGASDDVLIEECDIDVRGTAAVAPIKGITTLSTNVRIRKCLLVTDAEPGIELLTGTTGVISDCDVFSDLANEDAAIVADACALFRNQYVEQGGEAQHADYIGTPSVDD